MRQIESIFWGIIAALGALFIQLVFYIGYTIYTSPQTDIPFSTVAIMPQFIIISALIEEVLKYLIIAKKVESYSLEKTYIINSLLVGLGFFTVEFGLILSASSIPAMKILTEIAIVHMGTAGIMGYIVATKNPFKIRTFITALLITLIMHVSYNFLTINRAFVANIAIYFIFFILIFANLINFLFVSRKEA